MSGLNNLENRSQINHVLDFIFNDSAGKHILLLYEEPERAREIEFQFIKYGLELKEHCTFMIHINEPKNNHNHDDPGDHHRSYNLECMEREMNDAGIDIDTYKELKQLRIFPVSNIVEKAGGFDNMDHIWKEIEELDKDLFSQMEVPFRGVGIRLPVNKLQGDDRINALAIQVDIERKAQNEFGRGRFKGSWICPYRVDNLAESLEGEQSGVQLLLLIIHHHAVIYVPALKEPVVFRIPS